MFHPLCYKTVPLTLLLNALAYFVHYKWSSLFCLNTNERAKHVMDSFVKLLLVFSA